ncbi:MAG: ATP-dependent DNA helicase PcrA [Parcubacteria group bacterium GW2011_GWA2_42_11]|nr:MAG: ATP-dependent DNA helicase PcrA [Parcubacteria group bacterium GW2011_GWA2_42_11]
MPANHPPVGEAKPNYMPLKDLNPKQTEAVSAIDGPILIIAGPGSGKTRVLTNRVAYLIKQGIPAENILAVTFTNKAAQEIKERVHRMISLSADSFKMPTLGTFHSVGSRILRAEADKIGFKPSFTVFDAADSQNLIKRLMKELDISPEQFHPLAIVEAISQAKNELLDAAAFAEQANDFFPHIVAQIYTKYEVALKEAHALDFDDLIILPIKLFREHPDVLAKYQEKFKYILVDEYQDTNHAQYILINLLAKKYRHLFVIGDLDQNIYSWRGADFRNLLNFEKDYPEAKVIFLEQNYRSSQNILDAAHQIIIKNRQRKEKKLWTANQAGEPLTIFGARDEREEGRFIIEEIIGRCRKNKNLKLSDCAVLYRTNAQSRALEEAFLQAGLPYKVIGTLKFFERKEIKDLVAYLRIIQNFNDFVSLERIINVPTRGFGRTTDIRALLAGDNQLPISGLTPKKTLAWDSFKQMIDSLRAAASAAPLSRLLRLLIEKINYEKYLRDGSEEGEERWENVKEMFSVTKKYDTLPGGEALEKFLEEAALMSNHDEVETQKDLVNLMTLHCAKGLEWPIVFIAGCEEGIFPHSRSLIDAWQMEEERRLCYVGVTRAKEKLYLIAARARQLFGSTTINPPSRFIYDIPVEVVEYINFEEETHYDKDGIEMPF